MSDAKAPEPVVVAESAESEKIVGFAYNASLCPVSSVSKEHCLYVHHGDKGHAEVAFIDSASTVRAERLESPWDERSLLSSEFLSKTQHLSMSGQIQDDPVARYQRVALADEDARRLHREHIQRGSCDPIPFESILLQDPAAPGSERVLVNLACKGILNARSHGGAPHDITGDCRLVLTEIVVGAERTRRLYFFQVAPAGPHERHTHGTSAVRATGTASALLCSAMAACVRARFARRAPGAPPNDPARRRAPPPQAGAERRELSACEYAERERLEEQSRHEDRRREGGSVVTERTERREARTQERRDFAALAVRQTVSYLDALHVEEQLVHAYCEQVGSASEPESNQSCAASPLAGPLPVRASSWRTPLL